MFTTPCFIESSTKVRDWLSELGYEQFNMTNGRYIFTSRNSWLSDGKPWFSDSNFIQDECSTPEYVDCRGNFELFKALTALRNDSDYLQWFTDGTHWEVCPSVVADLAAWKRYYQRSGDKYIEPWKATKEELINHFKK